VESLVWRWFGDVKEEESRETWASAFWDSRMTVRNILEDRRTGYYSNGGAMVDIRRSGAQNAERPRGFYIRTMQGIAGVQERMNIRNYGALAKMERRKYEKGLWDVSACLLDPTKQIKIGGEGTQMYRTTGDTIYVFMPVTREEDMRVFFKLHTLAKSRQTGSERFKQFVEIMKSRLTRIRFAFEGDAGAKFLDFAAEGALYPKFKYGFGNIMKETESDEEIRQRKIDALTYKTILRAGKRNEIVLAYRQHGLPSMGTAFPMYAKRVSRGYNDHKGFVIVDENLNPTGQVINLEGQMFAGTAERLGGEVSERTWLSDKEPDSTAWQWEKNLWTY
jgi:hypothetical protein